jgi:hypothetical protein
MAGLNDIVFIKGQGGLGRPLPGQDFVSALIFYSSTLPSGFTTSSRIQKFYSITDAEKAGILTNYADETKASGGYTVTAVGSNGDTINLSVIELFGKSVNLGTYTKVAGDATVTAVATAIVAIINAGTITHGYTASNIAGVITIVARPGLGIFLNTGTPLVATIAGAITGTLVQFSGGVASKTAVQHYHISEFFRIQPQGVLYVGIFSVPGSYTFSEINTTQNFSNGIIRQVGVFKDTAAYAIGDLTAIHTAVVASDAVHKQMSALYAADMKGVTDISTVSDLSTLTANKASSIISQDGAALGNTLFYTTGKSVTTLGATLGAVALAKVSEDIAWVAKFNISDGTECDSLAFANGTLFSDATVTDNLLASLNNKRHIFLRKFVGAAGSYFNDSHTAIAPSSDYAYIEDNRTIDKAIRGIYSSVLPSLNGPLQLNSDGTLTDVTIEYLRSQTAINLDQMVRDSELSAYGITIDPTQNVLSTSTIIIAVKLLSNGVARNIQVPIGYTTSI